MVACSLFDIAFCRQDRNDSILKEMSLVSTEVSHALRSAYNHGLIQVLTLDTMNDALIEKAIRKIHNEASIAPYYLAKGLSFIKIEAGWKGLERKIIVDENSFSL